MEVDLRHGHAVGLGLGVCNAGIDRLGIGPDLLRHCQAVQDGVDIRWGSVMMVMVPVVTFVDMLMVMLVFMRVMDLVTDRLVNVLMDGVLTVSQGHVMAVFLLAVDGDGHVGAPDAAGGGGLGLHGDAGDQAVHRVQKGGLVLQQLVQSAHQHVASGTHIAVQI